MSNIVNLVLLPLKLRLIRLDASPFEIVLSSDSTVGDLLSGVVSTTGIPLPLIRMLQVSINSGCFVFFYYTRSFVGWSRS